MSTITFRVEAWDGTMGVCALGPNPRCKYAARGTCGGEVCEHWSPLQEERIDALEAQIAVLNAQLEALTDPTRDALVEAAVEYVEFHLGCSDWEGAHAMSLRRKLCAAVSAHVTPSSE